MALTASRRTDSILQSDIRHMSIECARVRGINLAQGVCDLPLPAPVSEGARAAVLAGTNQYTRFDGLRVLRSALAGKLGAYNGIAADPEKNIVVSAGATGAFYATCLALLDPGDEVVLFEPYYGYHLSTLQSVGAVPVFLPLEGPEWGFDPERLERLATPRTKALLLCTPSNPCGKVFSREELEQLAAFCLRHDLFLFSDETYEYFLYEGRRHVSPGALPAIADRTVTLSSYSKTFSITGWRIGYAAAREEWARLIGHVNDLVYVCAPAPLQAGVAAGITGLGEGYYADLQRLYLGKRDRICSTLAARGMTPRIPQGAYYVLADLGALPGETARERAMALLEKTGVACVPGSAFYHAGGETLGRFCYAKDDTVLAEACRRLEAL